MNSSGRWHPVWGEPGVRAVLNVSGQPNPVGATPVPGSRIKTDIHRGLTPQGAGVKKRAVRVAVLCGLWGAGAPVMAQPVEDCGHLPAAVGRLVCEEVSLAELDQTLAATYAEALLRSAQPGQVGEDQHRWEAEVRDACTDTLCLMVAYQERIQALQITMPALLVEAPPAPPSVPVALTAGWSWHRIVGVVAGGLGLLLAAVGWLIGRRRGRQGALADDEFYDPPETVGALYQGAALLGVLAVLMLLVV